MPKKVESKKRIELVENIGELVNEYDELRQQKKIIDKRQKDLSERIKTYAHDFGFKNDKGSYYSENGQYIFGSMAKKSVKFNDDAIAFLQDNGFENAVKEEIVYSVDEGVVETLVESGDLSLDDLKHITTTKTTYAVDIRKKEEIPEAEMGTFFAAQRK